MQRITKCFVSISLVLLLIAAAPLPGANGVDLLGAGATFPYPLYSKMFYAYWQETGTKINYQAIGSGGGQRQLIRMTVDFGGSDAFMSDESLAQAPAPIVHIPTCLGAVVVTYNLPGNPQLRFTPDLVSDIFLGNVTKWNDKKVTEINPEEKLPDMNIAVVHRSDGSGTTFVFTDYLSKVSDAWKRRVGRGKAVNWPVGLGAKGNPGVTGLAKYFPGAIGYVELGYALLNGMPVALLKNKSGAFIRPSVMSTSLSADVPLPEDSRVSVTDTDAPGGYPISSFTWILVYREQAYRGRPEETGRGLAEALWWMTHPGQKYTEPLHYAPLSSKAMEKTEKNIESMVYNGKPCLR